MANYFTGQLIPVSFTFAPRNTALAQGQLFPIQQNQALFSLLGVAYGGNGVTTFALPDTRGRTIVGFAGPGGTSKPLGQKGGEAAHILTLAEIPTHTHGLRGTSGGTADPAPTGRLPGTALAGAPAYGGVSDMVPLSSATLATAGRGQAHSNMQPSLAINFVIVLNGQFPSRP